MAKNPGGIFFTVHGRAQSFMSLARHPAAGLRLTLHASFLEAIMPTTASQISSELATSNTEGLSKALDKRVKKIQCLCNSSGVMTVDTSSS